MSGNSLYDFNYQQELSRFLHTGWVQQTHKLPNYDCRKTKYDSGSSAIVKN